MSTNSKSSTNKMDMLHGSLLDKILLFALPLAAGSILQQLFNAVDIAVVGRFASSEALAAVGANSSVVTLLINLFLGVSVGTNVVIANLIGQNRRERISDTVHTSIVLAFFSGIILMIFGLSVARPILVLMSTPENVLDLAVLYLRIYSVGMPFIMLYNFCAAILRSTGDTKRPLWCLILSGVVNAVLNVFFVVVFHMSVSGVALATVLSNALSAGMILYFLIHEEEPIRLDLKKLHISWDMMGRILRIGVPSGLQGMVFSFSNVFVQTSINSFGSTFVAGSAVAVNFEFICYFAINGFNQAAVTFTSQNYGAKKADRCKRIYRLCMICAVIACLSLDLVFVLGGKFFVSMFTRDALVAEAAFSRLRNVLLFQSIACSYEITGSALRGYGYSLTPSLLTVFGTCIIRIIWINTIVRWFHDFHILLAIYPTTWLITGSLVVIAHIIVWRKVREEMQSAEIPVGV